MQHNPYGPDEKYIKRPLDCFLSLFALVTLFPIIGVIAILVRIKLGFPTVSYTHLTLPTTSRV